MKKFGYAVLGVVVLAGLLFAIAAVVLASLNPNEYKDDIQQLVERQTGRTLTINGPIAISYYPILGFTVKDVSLSNPVGFTTEQSFASIEKLQTGVKLFPLLSGDIQIDTLRLVDPQIYVIQKANGQNNLNFSNAAPASQDEEKNDKSATQSVKWEADKVSIENGKLTVENQAQNQTYMLQDLDFSLSAFSFAKDASAEFSGTLIQNDMQADIQMSADINLTEDLSAADMNDIKGSIKMSSSALPETINISMSANAITAQLLLKTAKINAAEINWKDVNAKANGTVGWTENPTGDIQFQIDAGTLDVDALMAAFSGFGTPQQAPSSAPAELPVDMVRNLNIDGVIDVGMIKASGLTIENFHAEPKGQNGKINVAPVTFDFYGGDYTGTHMVDATGPRPQVHEVGTFKNIQLGSALQDYTGEDIIQAVGNLDFDVKSSGNTIQALMNNAGGNIAVDVGEGVLTYKQISERINQAKAFLVNRQMIENASDEVEFSSAQATFQGQSGVFQNNDLKILAPSLHALGMGQINLASNRIDYTVRVGKGTSEADLNKGEHIPIRISGPLNAPSYRLDIEALVRDQAQEKIEEKKQELIGKAFEKLGVERKSNADNTVEPAAGNENTNSETSPEGAAKKLLDGFLGGQ